MWSNRLSPFQLWARVPQNQQEAASYRICSALDCLVASPTTQFSKEGRLRIHPNDQLAYETLFVESSMLSISHSTDRLDWSQLSPVLNSGTYKLNMDTTSTRTLIRWLTPRGPITMEFRNARLPNRSKSPQQQRPSH